MSRTNSKRDRRREWLRMAKHKRRISSQEYKRWEMGRKVAEICRELRRLMESQ